MGLDFKGLVDVQRASRNQQERSAVRKRQRHEFDLSNSAVVVERQSRAIRSRFNEAYQLAARRKADLEPAFLLIERGIELLEEAE